MKRIAIACAWLLGVSSVAGAQRDTTGEFTFASAARRYQLHTPPARFGAARPLLVVLHGCTQDARQIAAGTRFSDLADSLGFIVLYPEQSPAANPFRCWQWFDPAHQGRDGEPGLIAAMTREVARRTGADSARIFVTGISAGGAMAVNLLAAHSDLFAAGAAHSAVPYAAASSALAGLGVMKNGVPSGAANADAVVAASAHRPLRNLLVIHGARDTVVAPINTSQLAAQWKGAIERHSGAPMRGVQAALAAVDPTARDVSVQRLTADGGLVVESFIVQGLGHAWSGGSKEGSFTDPQGPSATAVILRFFGLSP